MSPARPLPTEPRAISADEGCQQLLDHLHALVEYWASRPQSVHDVLEGFAFSVLTIFDGEAAGLPAFGLVPSPHPDDEPFCRAEGEPWWVPEAINACCMLHEMWVAR